MTLDEAIKHCLDIADGQDKCAEISVSEHAKERISQCAADHRQLAEWLTELKEAKRLLKAAVDDLKFESQCRNCKYQQTGLDNICNGCRGNKYEWRYSAEALALIGEDIDVPASVDDTNVGHKSGGWISVKDRLPDEGETVLIYAPRTQNQYYIAMFYTLRDEIKFAMNIYGISYCWYANDVTHWQPLPEPPKE